MDKDSFLRMDPNILLSIVNMKLRDFYSNLKEFCKDSDINEEELKARLQLIGYEYDKEKNQFK